MNQATPSFVGIVANSSSANNFINDVRKLLKNHSFYLVRRGRNPNRVQFVKDGISRRYTVGLSLRANQSSYFGLYLNPKPNTIGYYDAAYPAELSKAKTVVEGVREIYKQNNIQLS